MKPSVSQGGWSLTETLVVLAISALLMGWAWPQWNSARQNQHRLHAQMHLHQIAQELAWATLVNGQRPSRLTPEQSTVTALPYRFELATSNGSANAKAVDASGFILWAKPLSAQLADPCGEMWLDQAGRKGVSNAQRSTQACWGRAP